MLRLCDLQETRSTSFGVLGTILRPAQESIMAEDNSCRTAEGTHNLSDHEDPGTSVSDDGNEEHTSRDNATSAPRSRHRAKSCDSHLLDGKREQPCHFLSPLVSWDDSTFDHRRYVTPIARADDPASIMQHHASPTSRLQHSSTEDAPLASSTLTLADLAAEWVKIRKEKRYMAELRKKYSNTALFEVWKERQKRKKDQADPAPMNQSEMGLTIRRTSGINVFDDSDKFDRSGSDGYLSPEPPFPAKSVSANDIVEKRFLHPHEYFQELDELASKVFETSMFQFYMVS